MPPKNKKKNHKQLQRMLLQQIPQTPIPQPYFNIKSPDPYRFPLSQTLLQGIKLLQNYFPQDINQKIKKKLNSRIQRMSRYKDTYCMLGKGGNGLLIGDRMLDIRGISSYSYGPNYLVIAYQNRVLEVYDMNLQLIKAIKQFSPKPIKFIKILNVPNTFENIILLCHTGKKITIHRIEKSFFSKLSCKLSSDVISGLQFPVTQITQIPLMFKFYLRKDALYKDCSLVCVSAINSIYIIRINHFKLSTEKFWDVVYKKQGGQPTTNSISWGQATVNSLNSDIKGDKLILTYSFGQQLYFLAFNQVQKYLDGEVITKCQWIQSKPFILKQGKVAFCQYMKKSEILIVTEDNTVIIFHTKNFEIFDKKLTSDDIQKLDQKFSQRLQGRTVMNIPGKAPEQINPSIRSQISKDQLQMIGQVPIVTFADSFSYEYPSSQIYFLTQQQFGVYVYCNWKIIANILKVQQRYQSAMLFLIAMCKKANRFDLSVQGSQKQISEYVQMLATQFIKNKVQKIKSMPEIIQSLTTNQQFFKMIIIPLQLLIETQQFQFLFEVCRDKIISALTVDNTQCSYTQAETIFYQALNKFIQHGRVKYIPEGQLQATFDYYISHNRLDMVDRLAIYFDLNRIDRNIVIQVLLKQNCVVSLAHICTQGNQSQFITPFVKFWGSSENFRIHNKKNQAQIFAGRALWYIKLCLQRNWILKQYSFDKYAHMISILSQYFLTQKILMNLLQLRLKDCFQALSCYFTIQNGTIINSIKLNLPQIQTYSWIEKRQGNQQLEKVLCAIYKFTLNTRVKNWQNHFNLFLSGLIVYKTVKFTQDKYFSILIELIQNHQSIKQINFGLQQKRLNDFMENFNDQLDQLFCILASRFIIRTFTLIFYQARDYIKKRLHELYEQSRQYNLIDLQAEIAFTMGKFKASVDIYIRSKNKITQNLIFQFLENSFKRLVLEKRTQDKDTLAQCITQEIKWFVSLDPSKTKNIVDNYVPKLQQELIDALKDDQGLQLEYLEDIINDEGYLLRKDKLKDKTHQRFVQLMAKLKPQPLIQVFKKNTYLPIEKSLQICKTYEVYDCMEYLYERMGSTTQAVKIAALRIDRILKVRVKMEDDYQAPYIKIKQILDGSIQVCKNNNSEEVWQALLDSSIQLYQKYARNPDFPQDQLQVFFFINGQIMQNLAQNCPLQHTINLLQTKYQNLNMGGKMTKAFINILSNLSHQINILYIVSDLVKGSLQEIQQKDLDSKKHSYSTSDTCDTCGYALKRRPQTVHFRCGHAYHKQCVNDNPLLCIVCLMDKSDQFTYYLNTSNPMFPKIKKINELFAGYQAKKLEMSQIFKIQQYEQVDMRQQNIMKKRSENKKNKFQKFDENVSDLEIGNRRVLRQLHY